MTGTFLFSLICIFAWMFLSQAAKWDNKGLLLIGILILSLTSGLRAYDVGIDTTYYYDAFVSDFTARPWQFDEEGFRTIVRVLMALSNNPTAVFLVIAFVTNLLVIIRLWDFRNISSFSFMSFFYIAVFYIGTMNTLRQYLAVAIVFFATRYLDRKCYAPFVVCLLIASTIHTTALMGVLYLFAFLWQNTAKKKRIYLGLAFAIVIPAALVYIISYGLSHMDNYFSNSVNNVNITYLYRIACLLIAAFLLWMTDSTEKKRTEISLSPRNGMLVFLFTFLGVILSGAGMFFEYLSRLGYYFSLFEAVFWGMAMKRKAWGWLFFLMPTIYALYTFGYELMFNGSGILPFHFIFE